MEDTITRSPSITAAYAVFHWIAPELHADNGTLTMFSVDLGLNSRRSLNNFGDGADASQMGTLDVATRLVAKRGRPTPARSAPVRGDRAMMYRRKPPTCCPRYMGVRSRDWSGELSKRTPPAAAWAARHTSSGPTSAASRLHRRCEVDAAGQRQRKS